MANTLKVIELGKIKENPLNNRKMDAMEIENIKDSILEVGLLHPLTVYESSPGSEIYILVSGHKRLSALKMLGRMGATVQCTVIPKPSSTIKEQEVMARANVHRNSPEEIRNEVSIVNQIWNTMDSRRRKALTEKYRTEFEKEYGLDPQYLEDPAKYISQRFRPRMMYINSITGLNYGNKTIQGYLTSILKSENEKLTEEKLKKEKTITIKSIKRALCSLDGLIDSFVNTTTEELDKTLLDFWEVLKSTKNELGE